MRPLQRRHAAVVHFLGDGMTPNGFGLAGHWAKTLHLVGVMDGREARRPLAGLLPCCRVVVSSPDR